VDFGLAPAEAEYLESMQRFFDTWFPEKDGLPFGEGVSGHSPSGAYLDDEFHAWIQLEHHYNEQLSDAGFRGADWPVEYGGGGRSSLDQWLLMEEQCYRHLPNGDITIRSVSRALMQFGSDAQKRELLPLILRGEVLFSVAYTEPDAGSDLASLRTRAVRDGEDYLVTGQKIYTTFAQRATHIWLAVRTGTEESRHRGISVLIVPVDTPGVTIQNLPVQGGEKTNEVFFDGTRVPAANLVGNENEGWAAITAALAHERMQMHSDVTRLVEYLARWLRALPSDMEPGRQEWADRELASLAADLEVGRLLALQTVVLMDEGVTPISEAASAKIWLTELRLRLVSVALDLIAALGRDCTRDRDELARFEDAYLYAPVRRFAGGTNQVLRSVVAQRGLGLPRS